MKVKNYILTSTYFSGRHTARAQYINYIIWNLSNENQEIIFFYIYIET